MTQTISTTPAINLETVGETVRTGLSFEPAYSIDEHPDLGNCFEFSQRTHHELQTLGARSLIAFSFDHAFNVGAIDGRLYFQSGEVSGFSIDERTGVSLRHMFDHRTRQQVIDGGVDGSIVTHIDMSAIRTGLSSDAMRELEFGSTRIGRWFASVWLMADTLDKAWVTIMEPDFAFRAFKNYTAFKRTMASQDFEGVRETLESLRVNGTPHNETRPKYNKRLGEFERFVRDAVQSGNCTAADVYPLVVAYSEILPPQNAAANVLFGDCCRYIGEKLDSLDALDLAYEFYNRAGHYSRLQRKQDNELTTIKGEKTKSARRRVLAKQA